MEDSLLRYKDRLAYCIQVRFKICKDCLPLPESSFKRAIQDNYDGAKFKQALSRKQVKALILLFRSIACPVNAFPTASNHVPLPSFAASVVGEHVQPLPSHISPIEQGGGRTVTVLQSSEPIPPFYDNYGQTTHVSRIKNIIKPQQAIYQDSHQRGSATYCQAEADVPYQPNSSYYKTESHLPYVLENLGLHAHNPYGRYGVISDNFTRVQLECYGRECSKSRFSSLGSHVNPTVVRPDPLPRTAPISGRISYLNTQVSSRYSFAGATPSYR